MMMTESSTKPRKMPNATPIITAIRMPAIRTGIDRCLDREWGGYTGSGLGRLYWIGIEEAVLDRDWGGYTGSGLGRLYWIGIVEAILDRDWGGCTGSGLGRLYGPPNAWWFGIRLCTDGVSQLGPGSKL
jgi:hypothetical protein